MLTLSTFSFCFHAGNLSHLWSGRLYITSRTTPCGFLIKSLLSLLLITVPSVLNSLTYIEYNLYFKSPSRKWLKGTKKQRANNVHLTTTPTHPLRSAVNTAKYLSVALVTVYVINVNLHRMCINSSGSHLLAHNTAQHYLILFILPVSDRCIQVCLQIMTPAVCVLSQGFLFLLSLSHRDINPSFVRNSPVKLQYLSFNQITILPHISYRRDGNHQQKTRLPTYPFLFCYSVNILAHLPTQKTNV